MRRAAQSCVVLGLCLMVLSAVARAEDPTPTPAPTEVATPTAVATPAPVATVLATPEPTAVATSTPAVTATPTVAATPTATAVLQRDPGPSQVRQAPTPAPTPTAAPEDPDEFSGATITICHLDTFNDTYVTMVIDGFDQSDHYDHEDLIPAPAAGCPLQASESDEADLAAEPLLICHRNTDGTYRRESVGREDLKGHDGHKNDLIPAPNGTCPGLEAEATPAPTSTSTAAPDPTRTAVPGPTRTSTPEPTATATPTPAADDDNSEGGVLSGSGGGGTSSPPAVGTTAEELPFTGFELWLIATAGLGLAMAGLGLRLLAQPPLGVTL